MNGGKSHVEREYHNINECSGASALSRANTESLFPKADSG